MKKTLLGLTAAATLGIGLAGASAPAQAYFPGPGWHPGFHPGIVDPGFLRPRFHPGMYWGGHRIFYRPMYAGSYAGCSWGRVMTPWGPRFRPMCY
jgi:hypothetical protein